MSRSLKKGPYVDFKLAKKVSALGMEDRTIIKTWARGKQLLAQKWLEEPSRFIMVKSMFQF